MVQFYKATLALCYYLILSESSTYIAEPTPVSVETKAAWLTVRSLPRWPAHPFRVTGW